MGQEPHHEPVHGPAGGWGGAGLHTEVCFKSGNKRQPSSQPGRSVHCSTHSFALQVKVEEVLGEERLVTALAMQPVLGVGLAVGLVRHLLEELLAALLTAELFVASVQQGVSLQTGGVGEGLGTFLTDVRPECALSMIM